jgi:hypothetical protein
MSKDLGKRKDAHKIKKDMKDFKKKKNKIVQSG